jgi:hypothetical protein
MNITLTICPHSRQKVAGFLHRRGMEPNLTDPNTIQVRVQPTGDRSIYESILDLIYDVVQYTQQ